MSNIKIAGFQSNLFEELNDADLEAVIGGNVLSDVGGTVTGPGNESHPTSSLVVLVAGIGGAVSDYLGTNGAGYIEGTLQGVNGTVTGVTR